MGNRLAASLLATLAVMTVTLVAASETLQDATGVSLLPGCTACGRHEPRCQCHGPFATPAARSPASPALALHLPPIWEYPVPVAPLSARRLQRRPRDQEAA